MRRMQPIGTTVSVGGRRDGRGRPARHADLIAIQDATGGIVVQLPDGVVAPGARDTRRGPWPAGRSLRADRDPAARVRHPGRRARGHCPRTDRGRRDIARRVARGTARDRRRARSRPPDEVDERRHDVLPGRRPAARSGSSPTRRAASSVDSVTVGATYDVIGVAGQRAIPQGCARRLPDLAARPERHPSEARRPAPRRAQPSAASTAARRDLTEASSRSPTAIRRADGDVDRRGHSSRRRPTSSTPPAAGSSSRTAPPASRSSSRPAPRRPPSGTRIRVDGHDRAGV